MLPLIIASLVAAVSAGDQIWSVSEPYEQASFAWLFSAMGIAIVIALVVLILTVFPPGGENGKYDARLREIADLIHNGARSFLFYEYVCLAIFVVVVAAIFSVLLADWEGDSADYDWYPGLFTAINFIVGAFLSASCGYLGMYIATKANVRTTHACVESLTSGLNVAFSSGAVMGLSVTGLGLFGLSSMYVLFSFIEDEAYNQDHKARVMGYLAGFGAGGSSIALFARVGGGVYTKAADVGADLVGKVENDIPEDDPRNPAVIADNVGDNVGDVAGMGADLFESYVGSIIAAITIANGSNFANQSNLDASHAGNASALPLWIAGFGILASVIGVIAVMVFCKFLAPEDIDSEKLSEVEVREAEISALERLLWIIRLGIAVACVASVLFSLAICIFLFYDDLTAAFELWGCIIIVGCAIYCGAVIVTICCTGCCGAT